MLISFVSVSVFGLPADAGEKITLCISILLSLVVFFLLVSKILPPSLSIPLIAEYLLFIFIMNIIVIGCTVIVINRNYRTPRTHRMSNFIRVIFLNYLPRLLRITRPDHAERWKRKPRYTQPAIVHPVTNKRTDVRELTKILHVNCECSLGERAHTITETTRQPEMRPDLTEQSQTLASEINKVTNSIKFIRQHLENEDEYEMVSEWCSGPCRVNVWYKQPWYRQTYRHT
jgi:nicotinic acetylcholine receptor